MTFKAMENRLTALKCSFDFLERMKVLRFTFELLLKNDL
jgi:hypothetical protein